MSALDDAEEYIKYSRKTLYLTMTRSNILYLVRCLNEFLHVLKCIRGQWLFFSSSNSLTSMISFCDSDWVACPVISS